MIRVQIISPKIPGSISESVLIDFESETVEFAVAAKEDTSQDSRSSGSGDLLPVSRPETFCLLKGTENKEQLSPSPERSNAARRKFWEGRTGGEAGSFVMLETACFQT